MPLLLRNAQVLTMDDVTGARPVQRDLRIVGQTIDAIGADLVASPGDEVVDARHHLVTPGLVNGHTHSWETFAKGRYDNLPLELWMAQCYPILGDLGLTPELVRLRSLLFATESLKAGVTTIVDDVLETPRQDADQLAAVFGAYERIGIRANVSGHVINRPFTDTLPYVEHLLAPDVLRAVHEQRVPTTEEYLEFSRQALKDHHGSAGGRLRYMLAPSAPQRCEPDLLTGATELALAHGAECHVHALETKTQLSTAREFYDSTMIGYLDRLGALSRNTTIAHGIWVTRDDLDLLAAAGTTVSHNPISNLKLGSGIAPWRALHEHGVNVALGTDGCASSDSPRMLDVVKTAALLHKVTDPDFSHWPTVDEVLHSATRGGARSAVLDHEVGSLEVGKQADLVMFDLRTVAFTPRADLDKQLVYSENGSSIDRVMVAGRWVVEGGRVTTLDEDALFAEVAEAMEELRPRQDALDAANLVFTDAFTAMNERAMGEPAPVDRFSGEGWLV